MAIHAAPEVAPIGGCYVLDEPVVGYDVGAVFALPAGAQVLGERALVGNDGEVCVLRHAAAGTDIKKYAASRMEL